MINHLPDVAHTAMESQQPKLNWVGMDDIYLPIFIEDAGKVFHSQACASIAVDLPGGHNAAKGIHMSRLYFLLNELAQEALTPAALKHCLEAALASHQDLNSDSVRIELAFDLLLQRPPLVSNTPAGWRAYPFIINAQYSLKTGFSLSLQAEFQYSSTCPCSAALVRELLSQEFEQHFEGSEHISRQAASQWLKQHGTLATPHSQRSLALIRLPLKQNDQAFNLLALVDEVETLLATPVQTSVKRADELAFAKRNGSNLMFVEDISRKLSKALTEKYGKLDVQVRHLESLHAHNAFAQALSETHSANLGPQFKLG